MSFSREVKDFTEGFQQGYKIWSDADTKRETEEYHRKLYAKWEKDSAATAASAKGADAAAVAAAGKTAAEGVDPNKDLGGGGGGGNKPQLTPEILNDPDKMRDFVHQAESKGNYDATVYMANGKPGPTADLTHMTLEQVQNYQKDMIANGHASTALGAGQYKASTLNGLIDTLGLARKTTLFSKDTQDKLTDELLRQRGYDDFKAGKTDAARLLTNLSYEWASLPDPHTGRSHYDKQNGNSATVGYGSGIFSTTPEPLPGAAPKAAERTRYVGDPIAKPAATTPTAATQPAAAQPAGTTAPAPVLPVPPPTKPSMATPSDSTSTPRTSDLGATQNPIPVPASMMADAPGAAAIPPSVSPVQLADAQNFFAYPGHPNPLTQTFAGGGLVTPQPTQGPRYDSGSQVAESAIPPNALNVYQAGGNVMPPQLQASVQDSLPRYATGGAVEPEEENTEGDTSPVPGFDPNTPVEVAGYDGKFTAAQAKAAEEGDESTPGEDEYWAAVRRQQASLPPQQTPATPSQDPQLAASRPPGQAIPVTGSQAPGDTGKPTSFFDFIGKAIGGIADAVHAGLMGLGRMLGLSAAVPTGAPADPAAVQKLASGDGVKFSPEELKGIDKAIGIPDTLTPALRNVARLYAGYHYYEQKGDMAAANKYAGSMLATIQESVRMDGTMALLAGKHGDVAMMAKKLADAHNQFPNGDTMRVSNVSGEGASYEIVGPDGRVSQTGRATLDDMMKLATNTSNGTEFFKQAGYLGGKSTPQQIEADRAKQAVDEYMQAPGAITQKQTAWLAAKSPEQRAAIDKMDWKTKQQLMEKETTEEKQTKAEQDEQEATRLLGLRQTALSELQAAQSQRTNRLQPTNLETAAQTKLDAIDKSINAWVGADTGRMKYVRPLEGGVTSQGKSTGVGVTTPGAIPPVGGGKLTPTEQKEQRESDAQLIKDQAERVGTLQQERFSDEGKPLGGTRAKTRAAYQQVLQGQAVQKAYDESGAAKAPRKAELEKISGEVDQQSPDLADPKYDGLRQRFGQAASVFMNNNDLTAKQAVSIVKSITELSPDGKPKAEMSFTDDGRVKVGGYSPMIIDRETLGLLGNLALEHAKAQPIKPELNVVPRDPVKDEQDLQASQTGLGLRPRPPAEPGPPVDRAAATVPGTPGPSHGLWGELPPSSPMSPTERDEAGRGFRPLGMVSDLIGGKIPSAPPMQPPPTESPPGGFRPLGMVQDMLSPARRGLSPDERGEARRPTAIPAAGSPSTPYASARSPTERDEPAIARRQGAIDASRAAGAKADKLRSAVEDFIQNPQNYRQAKSRVQQLLDQQETERKSAQYWTPLKEKQNQGYVADIGQEARRQSEKSGVGMTARREDEQEVSRLATKGTMRAAAKERANQTIEGLRSQRMRRTAIPAAGS